MQLKITLFGLLFSLLIFQCKKTSDNPAANNTPGDDTNIAGYQLVWNDEFNASSLDETKWNYETGTGVNGDFGTGQLDRATNRSDNVSIQKGIPGAENGCLVITTRKETYIDRNYTSGRINTSAKAAWGPGYRIQAKIRAKDVRYKGQGFAFWMMPDEKPEGTASIMWPQGGEIDIMEYVAAIPYHNLGSVHYAYSWQNNQYQSWNHGHQGAYYGYQDKQTPAGNPSYGGYPPPENNAFAGCNDFHIYGIDWYSDRIEFFIDGNIYHIHYFTDGAAFDNGKADGQDKAAIKAVNNKLTMYSEYSNHFTEWHPFEHKFYIILSAGVGGNDNMTYGGAITSDSVFPCSVYIDWVRVYKRL